MSARGERVVGLLGGSFNPAHEGHLHISLYALKKLKIDEVWWMVSPGNPLKDPAEMAGFERRFASARNMASDARIRVTDIEQRLGTRYTADTLEKLRRRFPGVHFVWLMGADNLAHFHRWQRWQTIASLVPIVVFDRAPFSYTACASPAAHYLRRFLLKNNQISPVRPQPSLQMVALRRHEASSTCIRKKLGKSWVLGHNERVG